MPEQTDHIGKVADDGALDQDHSLTPRARNSR
jgi:hypothetical protein